MKFSSFALIALASLALAQDPPADGDSSAVAPAGDAPPADGATPPAAEAAVAPPAGDGATPADAAATTSASATEETAAPSADKTPADGAPPADDAASTPATDSSPPASDAAGSPAADASSSAPSSTASSTPPAPSAGTYQVIPSSGSSTKSTYLISVGRDNKPTFEPTAIRPKDGDTVRFNFLSNHTIVSANWGFPCQDNGVWSSASHPVQNSNGVSYVDFHVVSEKPIWLFRYVDHSVRSLFFLLIRTKFPIALKKCKADD